MTGPDPAGSGAAAPGPTTRTDELRTDRLLLRRWRDTDREPFAALNADPETMRFFTNTLTRAQSDAWVDRIEQGFDSRGYGLWAVEVPGRVPFAGFVGLNLATFDVPFTPVVEIGWRLARAQWGRGYATEAARAGLRFGFEQAGLDEVVSFTTVTNRPSRAVMERLGMSRDPAGDFLHPQVPAGHPLAPHVLYRLTRPDYPTSAPA